MNDADINIYLDPLSVRLDDEQRGPASRLVLRSAPSGLIVNCPVVSLDVNISG